MISINNNISVDIRRLNALRRLHSPLHAHQRQRLFDRYDALSDVCANLRLAIETLKNCGCESPCPEDDLAALEEIASGLARQMASTHAQLERCDAAEQAALDREYRHSTL